MLRRRRYQALTQNPRALGLFAALATAASACGRVNFARSDSAAAADARDAGIDAADDRAVLDAPDDEVFDASSERSPADESRPDDRESDHPTIDEGTDAPAGEAQADAAREDAEGEETAPEDAPTSPLDARDTADEDDAPSTPPPDARDAGFDGFDGADALLEAASDAPPDGASDAGEVLPDAGPPPTGVLNARSISVGEKTVCAVLNDQRVACWGSNRFGQLAQGPAGDYVGPSFARMVPGLISIAQVSVGLRHVCVRATTGLVRCWGDNSTSAVGVAAAGPITTPQLVGSYRFNEIAAGVSHTCGVAEQSGTRVVFCWGRDSYRSTPSDANSYPRTPTPLTSTLGPTLVGSITAGNGFSCALFTESDEVVVARCWGRNERGQCGTGSASDWVAEPTSVAGLPRVNMRRVVAGPNGACAIDETGQMYCWGAGTEGELGDGVAADRPRAVAVTGLPGGVDDVALPSPSTVARVGTQVFTWGAAGGVAMPPRAGSVVAFTGAFAQVDAAGAFACGRLSGSGEVRCIGANDEGQAGEGFEPRIAPPAQTVDGTDFTQVRSGGLATCVARGGLNTPSCFGTNVYGTLGANREFATFAGVHVVSGSPSTSELWLGGAHACIVTPTAQLRCWGFNSTGPVGDGTTLPRRAPTNVSGVASATAGLRLGTQHSCVIRSADSQLLCWGRNLEGQVGDGSMVNRTAATPITLGAPVIAVTTGGAHTCAVTRSTGGAIELWCWGDNTRGQLGDGTTMAKASPVRVGRADMPPSLIAAGGEFTCLVPSTNPGRVLCAGDNRFGQLGVSSGAMSMRASFAMAFEAPVGETVDELTAGAGHVCARTNMNRLYCWGRNRDGELGDVVLTNRSTPVLVLDRVAQASAGGGYAPWDSTSDTFGHTCAVRTDGTLRCWGRNAVGQLGRGVAWRDLMAPARFDP